MYAVQALIAAVGRILLVAIFLISAVTLYIMKFDTAVGMLAAEGVPREGTPNAQHMIIGAAVFTIVGSLSVMLGFKARIGAFLLAVFLCLATYYFHDFWNMADDPARQQLETIQFLKNASMLGAMLFIIANGSGPGSIDRRKVTITV